MPKRIEFQKYIKPKTIQKIKKLIENCNRPVIVVGSQCVSNYYNFNLVSEVLKKINIPIKMTKTHPMQ